MKFLFIQDTRHKVSIINCLLSNDLLNLIYLIYNKIIKKFSRDTFLLRKLNLQFLIDDKHIGNFLNYHFTNWEE